MEQEIKNYEFKEKLGNGSFGVVYKAIDKSIFNHNILGNNKTVVIKEIPIDKSVNSLEEVEKEIELLSRVNSKYVVKCYGKFKSNNKMYIVMEYCNEGDLSKFLANKKGTFLEERIIWPFFVQLCIGISNLHNNNIGKIIHRDLKPLNIFLQKDNGYTIKIGDFGLAKMLSTAKNFASSVVGTPYYLSPELCKSAKYNDKSDIWALGVILYELLEMKKPFTADNPFLLMKKIIESKPLHFVKNNKEVISMIKKLLVKDEHLRPSILQILKDPSNIFVIL